MFSILFSFPVFLVLSSIKFALKLPSDCYSITAVVWKQKIEYLCHTHYLSLWRLSWWFLWQRYTVNQTQHIFHLLVWNPHMIKGSPPDALNLKTQFSRKISGSASLSISTAEGEGAAESGYCRQVLIQHLGGDWTQGLHTKLHPSPFFKV